jgi:hypothetical protein
LRGSFLRPQTHRSAARFVLLARAPAVPRHSEVGFLCWQVKKTRLDVFFRVVVFRRLFASALRCFRGRSADTRFRLLSARALLPAQAGALGVFQVASGSLLELIPRGAPAVGRFSAAAGAFRRFPGSGPFGTSRPSRASLPAQTAGIRAFQVASGTLLDQG